MTQACSLTYISNFCFLMKWRSSDLLRAMLFQQKASGREELTRRKRKRRIQLAVLDGAMGSEMMEVFEPEEMSQGTRRSYQKGQAMKRCAGAERHHWESEKGRSSSSHILERWQKRIQGAKMISTQPPLSHFYQEEPAKVEATRVVQAEPGHFMVYFYLFKE